MGDGLVDIDIPRNPDELSNKLIYGVTDETNDLMCSMIGPNFLRVLIDDNDCSSGVLLPSAFKSKESFCYQFRNEWPPNVQKCMTDASIRILARIKGIFSFRIDLGACCSRCPGETSGLIGHMMSNRNLFIAHCGFLTFIIFSFSMTGIQPKSILPNKQPATPSKCSC